MTEVELDGAPILEREELRSKILTSSTKSRTSELNSVQHKVANQQLTTTDAQLLVQTIFDTYALYVDRESRQAAQHCLQTILKSPFARIILPGLIKAVELECSKPGIAVGNAFVLTEWCSILLQELAKESEDWEKWGTKIVAANALVLEKCLADNIRGSVRNSALVVTRRAFRGVLKSRGYDKDVIRGIIASLSGKSTTPRSHNSIILGVFAGVCARLQKAKVNFAGSQNDYYGFYCRELLGSRVVLPAHVCNGLHDFFDSFITEEDLRKELIPAVVKALLRSPEVVLNDMLALFFKSLPSNMDMSEPLQKDLLKPLMANVKSSNQSIRNGAVAVFNILASRSQDNLSISKIADEILGPLKQGKVTAVDQKILHAQMLSSLRESEDLTRKIPVGLAPISMKEANEAALGAETDAIYRHLKYAVMHGLALDSVVVDCFIKGLGDKKIVVRRFWALRFAELIWDLPATELLGEHISVFVQKCSEKLLESWKEVVANPVSAAQSGLLVIAYIITALFQVKSHSFDSPPLRELVKKASVTKNALVAQPKPSFLLNHRVYTKLSADLDITWAVRALTAVASGVAQTEKEKNVEEAWSHAFIYFITAKTVPPLARKFAKEALITTYTRQPAHTSRAVINGIWSWCENVQSNDKDSAASSAKSGVEELHVVLQSICVPPDELKKLDEEFPQDILNTQMLDLLIIARPNFVPKVSWVELCLRTGVDPGKLVRDNVQECLDRIVEATSIDSKPSNPSIKESACNAAADLAFVAPDVATAKLVEQFSSDLDPSQFDNIGPTEAAIYRTPEGTAFIDVLASKNQNQAIDKNTKDYDTLKWEQELRAQLAQKKGQTKKLTADEQAKIVAQITKESMIRKNVAIVDAKVRRGVGIVSSLASGPPTEADHWLGQAVDCLLKVIRSGAGLLVGDLASLAFISCSKRISSRLGNLRPFIGSAILRATGTSQLPAEYNEEKLVDLVTRVLYRLRLMSEQRPLDTPTLLYVFPLIFLVLGKGGIDYSTDDEANEQLILAVEFISFHTDSCSNEQLPRGEVIASLKNSMQRFTQHYKLIKDCFVDFCRGVAPTINSEEISILMTGAIVPQVSVRTTVLQAIDAEIDLSDLDFSVEVFLACHDDVSENVELAQAIWEDSDMNVDRNSAEKILPYIESTDKQLRRAAARSLAEIVGIVPDIFDSVCGKLENLYVDKARPLVPERDEFGMVRKKDVVDPWETRDGIALTFRELASVFKQDRLEQSMVFMVTKGPLGDRNNNVRDEMIDAAKSVIAVRGRSKVEQLMRLFESSLEGSDTGTEEHDKVNEAVIILYGALARHLNKGDQRVPKVVHRLLVTLSTPSETVQYAVAECLPPLVRASSEQASTYIQQMMEELLNAKKYAARRGAAYGLAGIIRGKGVIALREHRVLATLKGAAENKREQNQRQATFLAYELLSLILGRIFEPYVIQIVPQLLSGFGDPSADVREACLDSAKICFSNLSSFGVKQVLPTLLDGLDEQQWRSKKGACDSLGAMAYLDPQQLALSLPDIIPPLTNVLNDSHKEVRTSANRSLQRFGEVISNPEIKSTVGILLKALSDPTKYTDDALDSLIKVSFVHYLDAPSLALVVRILQRGLSDRSGTKRKSAQIIGSLAHLTERKDLTTHLPILVAGLKLAIVDPVPATRATASKALGSLIEKLGEDALPDLIPSLMATLKSDSGAGDRLGSAQALSEVLAGLGTRRLEETLPSILQNVSSAKPSVREGFMSLFIYLPACFGNSFANYLGRIIPPILSGLADDIESIRDTALRAGRLLVKNFATKAIDLLLPELERGMADDSHRIRLSSVELVGDLLFNLTGISASSEEEEQEEGAKLAGHSLLEVLGEEKRNKVLSALYICRCDTSGLVRSAAVAIWKALVSTPRTLRELIPVLTQLIIRRLASSNMEQKVIAGNALGELIRKAGEGVLASLLPTLEDGLQSTDADAKQGICIALRELISSASPEVLEEYEKTLISVVRTALVDADADVREAAAEAFDSLQRILGKKAVDQVLPYLLSLLRSEDSAQNALSALLTLLTDNTRSNIILPNLLPTLLTSPITSFNARALASLAEVAGTTMTRRLPNILNTLMDNIVKCSDDEIRSELDVSFDAVLLSVDEYDGLNTAMSVILQLCKHDDHKRRHYANSHVAKFISDSEIDISRYYPDLIRTLLIAFDDRDAEVVKSAWTALNELMKRLRKEEMESLVVSTRQVLNQVGVAGSNLPGFMLPKGINAILPIFLQGLMNGTAEQRTQSALAISDIIDRTSGNALRPFVTQITGPLIRVISERSVEVKASILFTLNNLLEKIPIFLKPFLPQLQRTFAKCLADTSSEILRVRAARALGTLITLTPRIDPLIAELVTGAKTTDQGVRNAMFKALYEVVSKAGSNMNESSRNAILGLIDGDTEEADDAATITNARLFGALIKTLPKDVAANLIKSRVLTSDHSNASVLALNAVLLDSPDVLTSSFVDETTSVICEGIASSQNFVTDNCVLAAGKLLLSEPRNKSFEVTKPIFEALAPVIQPGNPIDSRRLSLVVIRTVSREMNDLVRPHLALLGPPIFASVRDPVIPIKLSAEAAFLAIFSVVEEESVVFEKYLSGAGASLPPNTKRSMQDYFKRIATRLASQARERKEAEGGQGGLGLSGGEKEDERELWSVGKVDLGDVSFAD